MVSSQPKVLLQGFLNMMQNTVAPTPFEIPVLNPCFKIGLWVFSTPDSIPDAVLVFSISLP